MTENERIARANRAKAALDEFLYPALASIEAEYGERMITAAASTDPRANEIIARLANGVKVARQVRSEVEAFVADGKVAEEMKARNARIAEMNPAKARLLKIGSI